MADDKTPQAEKEAAKAAEAEINEEVAAVEGPVADDSATPKPAKKAEPKPAATKTAADKLADKKPATKKPKQAAPKATGYVRTPEERGRGKKYLQAAAKLEADKLYSLDEAAKLIKETSITSFDASVELHFRLGVDPRQADQNVRGTVKLPAGTGKERRVFAFVPAAQHAAAKKAGADFVSDEPTLKKLKDGWTEFDVTVATPDQMAEVGKLGQTLGPKGLMPNPKAGTVTPDFAKAIDDAKQGTVEFRVAKDATIHAGVGKVSFTGADLVANLSAYCQGVASAKPDDLKGTYLKTVTVTTTMGPPIPLDPAGVTKG